MRARSLVVAAALAVGSLAAFAPAASAGATATVCYSVTVTVNGEAVVDEADCQTVSTP